MIKATTAEASAARAPFGLILNNHQITGIETVIVVLTRPGANFANDLKPLAGLIEHPVRQDAAGIFSSVVEDAVAWPLIPAERLDIVNPWSADVIPRATGEPANG